jgi:hypothetical protein
MKIKIAYQVLCRQTIEESSMNQNWLNTRSTAFWIRTFLNSGVQGRNKVNSIPPGEGLQAHFLLDKKKKKYTSNS